MVKPKKNAFSFFLEEYVRKQRKAGRDISMKVGAEECSLSWKSLPVQEKQVYTDLALANRAKRENVPQSQAWKDPLVSSEVTTHMNEVSYLNMMIRHEKALRVHRFHLIHCNYFCKTVNDVYFPAEIAISEFNLEDGVLRTYHTLVDPGRVQLGYAYEVKRLSEVHGIPSPPYDAGEKDMRKIVDAINAFMEESKQSVEDELPPLFVLEANLKPTSDILCRLFSRPSTRPPFTLFPLHKMFFWLKNKAVEECGGDEMSRFHVLSNAVSEIEKDVYRYYTNISCHYHEGRDDVYFNCSLSVVQRMAYIICDHCCQNLNIEMVPGKHIHAKARKRPVEEKVEEEENEDDNEKKALSNSSSDEFTDRVLDQASSDDSEDYCGASSYAGSVAGRWTSARGRRRFHRVAKTSTCGFDE